MTTLQKLQTKVENYLKKDFYSYICKEQTKSNYIELIEVYEVYKDDKSPSIELTFIYYTGLVKVYEQTGFLTP